MGAKRIRNLLSRWLTLPPEAKLNSHYFFCASKEPIKERKMKKDLLTLKDLTKEEFDALFARALELKKRKKEGKTLTFD